MPQPPLHCWIYKGNVKDETYLYLAEEDAFDTVPQRLLQAMGELQRVMELDLHPGRTLAREDVNQVIENLRGQGYHLQLPPPPAPWPGHRA